VRGFDSGERGDVLVGAEDVCGGGPGVEDPDDVAPRGCDDACRSMPQGPAEPFRFRPGEWPGKTQHLEPGDEV